MNLRLISWNLAGWYGRAARQWEAIKAREPDIVALQEVRRESLAPLREAAGSSHPHWAASLDYRQECTNFNLVVSRWPLRRLQVPETPLPERWLAVTTRSNMGAIQIHNLHIPDGSSNGWKKIETFEALRAHLAKRSQSRRILCGDFNSPKAETPDGSVTPFGDGNPRWEAGELSVITGLADIDMPDVFRKLNGYGHPELTWAWRRGERSGGGRFDHIFASPGLDAIDCRYHHNWRISRLSDHSAIEATFEISV